VREPENRAAEVGSGTWEHLSGGSFFVSAGRGALCSQNTDLQKQVDLNNRGMFAYTCICYFFCPFFGDGRGAARDEVFDLAKLMSTGKTTDWKLTRKSSAARCIVGNNSSFANIPAAASSL
jgi:hypothetical protein